MKRLSIIIILVGLSFTASSQKYLTQSGVIKFYSETAMENIEADNNQVSSVINMENGEVAFSLLMKAFNFEKALMQEHFNEKYVESDKYPKAKFKGKIKNFDKLTLTDEGSTVTIVGNLTIHGVTKEITITAKLNKSGEAIAGLSEFTINLDDYNIKIPKAVDDKISKAIRITVSLLYEKLD